MSYPGYHQPDFLESIAKGLQVRSMVEEIRARREARAQQAELHRLAIEQHQQQNNRNNFETTMMLQNIGAIPAGPNDAQVGAALDQTFGAPSAENLRARVTAPDKQDYYLPSRKERFSRAQTAATEAGTLKGIETNATTALTDPEEDIQVPEEFGGGTRKVRHSKVLDYQMKLQDSLQKQNPDMQITYADDPQGNRTYFGTNKQSGETKTLGAYARVAKPQAVRTAGGKSQSQINLEAEQEVINKHFGGKEEVSNPAYERAVKEAAARRVASGESRNLQEAVWYFRTPQKRPADLPEDKTWVDGPTELWTEHPELFDDNGNLKHATVDVRSTPQFKAELRKTKLRMMTEGAQTKGAASASVTSAAWPKEKPIPSKDLNAMLKRPDVQKLGIRDVNALRKYLYGKGYTVAD